MKESRKKGAKEGADDPMADMRKRYERAVEAETDNRQAALDDLRFVTIPGYQWDEQQKKARKNRPCYEFPILRSHWRQVVNDQKKARPGIKVRAVEDGDAKGAELRQGIIRNIESMSNAERAYDAAFESLTACGMGAWRVTTEYSQDDGWEQDIRVKRIADPLTSVWFDPDAKEADLRDARYCFVEECISRDEFKERYPKAEAVDFDSAKNYKVHDWFREDTVRIAEYWRTVPVTKTLLLLSDGRTIDQAEITPEMAAQFAQEGVGITKERECHTTKVVMSIVSGREEIDGPHDSVFSRIPVVMVHANRHFIEGKWVWAGMVRFSRDPQKLLNYNLTTAQEVLAKQHKATPIVTPKMLEGAGVKAMWDASGAVDQPYLPITPDAMMPQGPHYLNPPPLQNAFVQMAQMSTDMLKASDGIFDASVGARSNETSGKAIMARQQEGDTATFDYQDALSFSIQATGEIILSALPKVYDTPRAMRVLGKDGAEDWVKLYEEVQNPQTGQPEVINDLSAGKYDVTVTTGPSYDTMRMEFVEVLTQLGQGNPMIAAGIPDLIVGSLDFPKAEEAAERMKLLLPPQVQQSLNQKDESPAVMQMRGQMEQMQQQVQQQMQEVQQHMQQLEDENRQLKVANANKQGEMQLKAREMELKANEAQPAPEDHSTEWAKLEIERYKAETERMALGLTAEQAAAQFALDSIAAQTPQGDLEAQAQEKPEAPDMAAMLDKHHAAILSAVQSRPRKTSIIRDKGGNIIGAESVDG